MRLKRSAPEIRESLSEQLSNGYEILECCFNHSKDLKILERDLSRWVQEVKNILQNSFPSLLEVREFSMAAEQNPSIIESWPSDSLDELRNELRPRISCLDRILSERIEIYADLPVQEQLYIEDIDSFSKVRSINPHLVDDLLVNGRIEKSEDNVQLGIERILGVSFHKADWGGEQNDLFTANLMINGKRRQTAFLLKGNGCKSKEMQIKDCGKNGDQIIRLFGSPADFFVVQYVGPISESVVAEAGVHNRERRRQGFEANFCVIDGQDTARLLRAYGKA